jgi:DNA-binding transcriptional regulator YiaG
MTNGGEGISGHRYKRSPASIETKCRISLSLMGKVYPPRTQQHLNNLSKSLRGKKFSDERKANISRSRKGKSFKLTLEQIEEIRNSPDTQKVLAKRYNVSQTTIFRWKSQP